MDKAEFDLIKSYFAPLTAGYDEAYGLTNDAALISLDNDRSSVVTMDTLVEGVHFFGSDPADDIARKCLRVNLSDLAAMGAQPIAYTLSMAYSDRISSNWVKVFTDALSSDQITYGCHLIGGDTVATPGPLTITITCFGSTPRGSCLMRNNAKAGDEIWVSGTIGDSTAGLRLLKDEITYENQETTDFLINRYRVPQPRTNLGVALLKEGLSITALDVSDGLLADTKHIAQESGLKAKIHIEDIPLSPQFKNLYAHDIEQGRKIAVSGGDDYEILFTSAPQKRRQLEALSQRLSIPLSKIGTIEEGEGCELLDNKGNSLKTDQLGWRHF